MTYRQMEKKLIENRAKLRTSTDLNEKRRLIAEDHELMKKMDAAWTKAQDKPIWGGR